MAFNPFHSFRKHQKVIFAGLVIICMITFILSFGPGDPFQQLGNLFGSGKPVPPVIIVYGDKVNERDLDQLRMQRLMANDFMRAAVAEGQVAFLKEAKGAVNRYPSEYQFRIRDVVESTEELYKPKMPDGGRAFQDYLQAFPHRLRNLKEVLRQHPGEAEFTRKLAMMMYQQVWLRTTNARTDFYFAGSTRADDLLDFMVWKRQADQLGINLTDKDVRAEVNNQTLSRDTLTGDTNRDLARVTALMRQVGYADISHVPVDQFYAALRDELRAGMAQAALLGYQGGVPGQLDSYLGVNAVPAAVTPDQFWNYYSDNRTTLKVALLPIPVKAFVPQVTGSPSADELRALFREYKDREPNPDSDTPGFRQPRRVQVQWVSAQPDSPRYEQKARERVAAIAASVVGDRWRVLGLVKELHDDYQVERMNFRLPAWTETTFALGFYTSASRAENLTATVGALASAGWQGSPLAALTSYQAAAVARDAQRQAPFVAQEARERALLAAGFPLAGSQGRLLQALSTMVGLYDHGSRVQRSVPLSAVTGEMMQRMQSQQARLQVSESLQKVRKEVESWKTKTEKEAADALAKLVQEHGLNTGGTKALRDQHEIEEDEGIKPLKDPVKETEEFRARMMGATNLPKFRLAMVFFRDDKSKFMPRDAIRSTGSDEHFLYWKTQDVDGQTYPSYADAPEEIKERVREAWRLQKARELARRETEQVQAKARAFKNAGDAVRFLRDEGKQHGWNEVFELDGIARLVEAKPSARAGLVKEYEPYKPPEDKINARPDFADQPLRALKEPGDVTVTWNRPETIYYVVVLEERKEETERDFVKVYGKSAGEDLLAERDTLLERLEQEQRQKFRQGLMEHLRAEAQGNDQGEWALDAEVRKRLDGRGRDSD